jgi:uncharacterized protein involved in exopolysaccharide biosynthesis
VIVTFLETFFRHKLLVLLPTILIPLIVGPIALLTAPTYYESWAGIWVERPVYLRVEDGWNGYNTPANNQQIRLTELLRTHSFVLDVAQRTALAPLAATEEGETAIRRVIGDGIALWPSGNQLLTIRFRAESPTFALEILNAILQAFQERLTADRLAQSDLAVSFYGAQLQDAEQRLSSVNEAMSRYVALHPYLTAADPLRGPQSSLASQFGLPIAATDPQLAELVRRVELQQREVERARSSLEQARFSAAASIEGQELSLQIVDAPRLPSRAIRERRKALIYPAAGMLAGMGLSAGLLLLLVATDRSVRRAADFAPATRLIGTVPRVRMAGAARELGPAYARRAIGYVAGTALPALPGLPALPPPAEAQ